MINTRIIFKGHIPSKKNNKRRVYGKNGMPFMIPSAKHEEWKRDELINLKLTGIPLLFPPYKIIIFVYPPDKKNGDLSNRLESIQDLLVNAGILEDDNWFLLQDVHVIFMAIDRQNPRFEVFIESNDKKENLIIPEIMYSSTGGKKKR